VERAPTEDARKPSPLFGASEWKIFSAVLIRHSALFFARGPGLGTALDEGAARAVDDMDGFEDPPEEPDVPADKRDLYANLGGAFRARDRRGPRATAGIRVRFSRTASPPREEAEGKRALSPRRRRASRVYLRRILDETDIVFPRVCANR
jgi:hypothetical protein